jgi:NAD(P)-dependent dehydrogenase (short-subunit alcohol dehydrogenase family)
MPACLVTGAARRIGAGLTRALVGEGWTVVAHYNSSPDEAEELAMELGADKVLPLQADLSNPSEVAGLIATAADRAGVPLSLLVNNASLFEEDHAGTLKGARWDQHMQVNLKAPAFLSQDFAAQVPGGTTGLIVNLLDQKLWNLNPDFFSYTVSKAGLRAVTEMLAQALAPKVRVCGIASGIVLPSTHQSQAHFEKVHNMNPLARGAKVEDIARTLLFLIDSPAISGQTILVDGGQHFSGQDRDVLYAEPGSKG